MDLQSIKRRFDIIGNSPGLNYALNRAIQVAPTNLSVLIAGESGVGKEIISQVIHFLSPRKHNSSIAINCGAIPEGTIDSELFGHEKGAFTDAHEARKGYFETVNTGTIFLDEISEMPLGTQSRLLRILESGEFIKVGSSKVQQTDVRIIAATNVDLLELARQGKFREDRFYRINTVPIIMPPLRERQDDIYMLFRKFCNDTAEKYKKEPVQIDEEAKELLINHKWYGNIRELKNIAEQISILSSDNLLTKDEFLRFIPDAERSNLPVLANADLGDKGSYSERELMYKVLFDMKSDISELKKVVGELLSSPTEKRTSPATTLIKDETSDELINFDKEKPIIIEEKHNVNYEEADEPLSIADKEKELIIKALKRHKSKRKYAALDLGISERTLYRKIKEYDINV